MRYDLPTLYPLKSDSRARNVQMFSKLIVSEEFSYSFSSAQLQKLMIAFL